MSQTEFIAVANYPSKIPLCSGGSVLMRRVRAGNQTASS